MQNFVMIVHILACVFVILLVLLQSGKGAEISASFGGSSQTVFGSAGGANFFTKLTTGAAAVFMLTSLFLTVAGTRAKKSVLDSLPPATTQTAPAAPGSASPAQTGAETSAAPATTAAPAAATTAAAPAAKTPETKKAEAPAAPKAER